MENEIMFERRVVDQLSSTPRIILRKNSASCRGFTGRRKPDLVSIESDLELIVWELKSPIECSNICNERNMWLRHPTPGSDYIATTRERHAGNTTLPVNVRGWCVVIDGELRYWINNHGNSWKLPFDYTNRLSKAAIAAPADQKRAIDRALRHLGLNWQVWIAHNIVFAQGGY